jgi:hypothetical protein
VVRAFRAKVRRVLVAAVDARRQVSGDDGWLAAYAGWGGDLADPAVAVEDAGSELGPGSASERDGRAHLAPAAAGGGVAGVGGGAAASGDGGYRSPGAGFDFAGDGGVAAAGLWLGGAGERVACGGESLPFADPGAAGLGFGWDWV